MIAHYRSLGVRDCIIHAQTQAGSNTIAKDICRIASAYGAEVASNKVQPWLPAYNTAQYTLSRAEAPNDWFILADQDELQVYPDDLMDVIKFCDRKGYDFIEGCLVDRFSESGVLASVKSGSTVWEQFPLGSILSARVLGAVVNKVVAAKGHVKIGPGQHHAHSGIGCPPSELYIPVHHFKWVEGLLSRLRSRIESLPEGLYTRECSRFLSYYGEEGRIRLDDPDLLVSKCGPEYPHWKVLRDWRVAAAYFSAHLASLAYRPTGPRKSS
jgi:hypothetical protein